MKTITEYQPMIFSQMAEHAEKRSEQRRQLRGDALMIGIYSIGALWLSYDTGIAVWHWQFWMIFLPFFVAGELAERALREHDADGFERGIAKTADEGLPGVKPTRG